MPDPFKARFQSNLAPDGAEGMIDKRLHFMLAVRDLRDQTIFETSKGWRAGFNLLGFHRTVRCTAALLLTD